MTNYYINDILFVCNNRKRMEVKMKIEVNEITCQRCGHKWVPRKTDIRSCPNPRCRSVYFDRAKPDKPEPEPEPKPKLKKLKGFGGKL